MEEGEDKKDDILSEPPEPAECLSTGAAKLRDGLDQSDWLD